VTVVALHTGLELVKNICHHGSAQHFDILPQKAGLQVPYDEAFIFGIGSSFKPGRETDLNTTRH